MDYLDTEKIKQLCTDAGLEGEKLQSAAGLSAELVRILYIRPYRPYRKKTLHGLADALKVDPSALTISREKVIDKLQSLQIRAQEAEKAGLQETAAAYRKEAERIKRVL